MLELIDRAGAVGWGTVLVAIALVILLVPIAIEGWNRLLKSLGLVKKKSLQEAQREKEIAEIYKKIGHVQDDIVGKQAEYHERVSICRTESHCPQHSYKTVHPMGCSNILNTEKNTTA